MGRQEWGFYTTAVLNLLNCFHVNIQGGKCRADVQHKMKRYVNVCKKLGVIVDVVNCSLSGKAGVFKKKKKNLVISSY